MKRMIPVLVAVMLLFTACAGNGSAAVTTAYAQLEGERGQKDAVAMVVYDVESVDLPVSDRIGEDEDYLLILPRYVGSKVKLYSIQSTGPDAYEADGVKQSVFEVKKDTVIRVDWTNFRHNHMWCLEIETPDGKVYESPIPDFCEREEDTIYIGRPWDGKDHLPYNWGEEEIVETLKPVIYLYPQEPTEVSVELEYGGNLTCTYPKYNDGWTVIANPDGSLTDAQGKEYNYLYWEGLDNRQSDFSRGFCVSGEETATFLESALEKLGLTRKEANEFIVYWLPLMEQNPYNVISFQGDVYTDMAKLHILPEPDTMIRVFMAWYAVEEPVTIPAQELTAPERIGFTVVEWGGEMKAE